jgi:hypothetical protein
MRVYNSKITLLEERRMKMVKKIQMQAARDS